MNYNPDKHHRRSIRLKEYDYSRPGFYFVTVCIFKRECLFGEIINGRIHLSQYGEIVSTKWFGLSGHFGYVIPYEFIIMPNHIHGIININEPAEAGSPRSGTGEFEKRLSKCDKGLINTGSHPPKDIKISNVHENQIHEKINMSRETIKVGGDIPHQQELGKIIAYFKYISTKHVNMVRKTPGMKLWQRNYYEHIIREENELTNVQQYIIKNPQKWEFDNENPQNRINK